MKKIDMQGFLEECDRNQCDFKMVAKMRKISKCYNFNENWYVGFFPHEECDSDKSDLKMASYLCLILQNLIKF